MVWSVAGLAAKQANVTTGCMYAVQYMRVLEIGLGLGVLLSKGKVPFFKVKSPFVYLLSCCSVSIPSCLSTAQAKVLLVIQSSLLA